MRNKERTIPVLKILFIVILSSVLFSTFADYKSAEVIHHLGKKIPADLIFKNSNADIVRLGDIINKPTILDFCYYRCAGICTPLMMELDDIIGKVKYEPGIDYNIISISIDQNEDS